MSQVIAKLLEDHRRMAVLLDVLEREINEFSKGETLNFFLIETILDYMTNYPQTCHHPVEEVVHKILLRRNPSFEEDAFDILKEHETLTSLTTRFSEAFERIRLEQTQLRDDLVGAARDFQDYHLKHMQEEEAVLFPAAESALYQSDWDIIEMRLSDKGDPIFGREADREYRALHKVIVDWGER